MKSQSLADGSGSASWYELRGGRRHVRPYEHAYTSYCKGRWVGKSLLAVFQDEFPHLAPHEAYLTSAAADGRLTVNGAPAAPDHVFRHGDRLVHATQRVEPSVPDASVGLLLADPDLIAVSKPAGLPVHHAGRYRRNTLVEVLQHERPELELGDNAGAKGGLHVLHRLDRLVSGVLLLPRTVSAASQLAGALQAGKMRKRYLARVAGRLAAATGLITVTAPIRIVSAAGSTTAGIDAAGKPAVTCFRSLAWDERTGTSLVLAEPFTGRTHQIRLHLQHLGHPIANEPVYALPAQRCELPLNAPKRARRADGPGVEASEAAADAAGDAAVGDAEAAVDELWLHAWSYTCDSGPRTFDVTAPPPHWAAPFAPLLSLAELSREEAPVALDSETGQALLRGCAASDRAAYDRLWSHFRPQLGRTMCGPASVAMLLRAAAAAPEDAGVLAGVARTIGGDEDAVLDGQSAVPAAQVRSPGRGLTLPEIGRMLVGLGVPEGAIEVRHALGAAPGDGAKAEQDSSLLELVRALRASPPRQTLLNYHMSAAGQRPFGGHFSPLGAYHEGSGRFLVLDVWPDTGPCWIDGDRLWTSLVGEDGESGLSRGWATVAG